MARRQLLKNNAALSIDEALHLGHFLRRAFVVEIPIDVLVELTGDAMEVFGPSTWIPEESNNEAGGGLDFKLNALLCGLIGSIEDRASHTLYFLRVNKVLWNID